MKQEQIFRYGEDESPSTVVVRWEWLRGNHSPHLSVTGTVRDGKNYSSGCCHEMIRQIPDVDPRILDAIRLHLADRRGPMHYIANTVYLAGERDHNGLRKGERRQIRHGGKEPCWKMELVDKDGNTVELPYGWSTKTSHGELSDLPALPDVRLVWKPWETIGEGKERDLKAARSCACADWSEDHILYLSDEDLVSDHLETILTDRLPFVVDELRKVVESFGFDWNLGVTA